MKTTSLFGAALLSALIIAPAHADSLGLYVGAQAWQNEGKGGFAEITEQSSTTLQDFGFDEDTNVSVYVNFEHPLPLIPNVRARTGKLTAVGATQLTSEFTFNGQSYSVGESLETDLDFTNTDITIYYEILDNDLVGFDVGITAKYLSGEFFVANALDVQATEDASLWIPMGYVAGKVALPGTGIFAYGDINLVSYDDNSIHDYQVGMGYSFVDNFAIDASVLVGYREVAIELDDVDDISADLEFSGLFAGVELHF